jgi:hypothetical protein
VKKKVNDFRNMESRFETPITSESPITSIMGVQGRQLFDWIHGMGFTSERPYMSRDEFLQDKLCDKDRGRYFS